MKVSDKIIVYSVNVGGYDKFRDLKIKDNNVEYILFTDDISLKSDLWTIKNIDFVDKKLDNRKKSRYLKMNPQKVLPEHSISVYFDHCFEPQFDNLEEFLNEINFINSNIMMYKHSMRNCTYDEATEVLKNNLDFTDIVNSQMKRYMSIGFPSNLGLFESAFIIRKNTPKVNFFNETWWNEIKKGSGRDQLSQMYTSWFCDVKITPIPIGKSCYDTKYFGKKHKHEKSFFEIKR